MNTRQFFLGWLVALSFLLSACTSGSSTTTAGGGSTPEPPPAATATPEPQPTGLVEVPESNQPHTLRIWLPPRFALDNGTPEAELLQQRLDAFALLHPEIQVEVRTKGETGAGGMLASLIATRAAVPEAMPDLLLLPQSTADLAVRQGLLVSLETTPPLAEAQDWYDFALTLGQPAADITTLPFAADALVFIYRTEPITTAPKDWMTTQNLDATLAFPANSNQALFPLALYLAAGGPVDPVDGTLQINTATLTAVLRFFEEALENGVLSPEQLAGTDFETTLAGFLEGGSDAAVAWTSQYLNGSFSDVSATTLPAPGGVPFTLITGWSWAAANPDPEKLALATELANSLVAEPFLSEWTEAAGYLPARPSALSAWSETPNRALASQIVLAAVTVPPEQILGIIGPIFKQATQAVLFDGALPDEAAMQAAEQLGRP
jgi:maltose-binding protein MalE